MSVIDFIDLGQFISPGSRGKSVRPVLRTQMVAHKRCDGRICCSQYTIKAPPLDCFLAGCLPSDSPGIRSSAAMLTTGAPLSCAVDGVELVAMDVTSEGDVGVVANVIVDVAAVAATGVVLESLSIRDIIMTVEAVFAVLSGVLYRSLLSPSALTFSLPCWCLTSKSKARILGAHLCHLLDKKTHSHASHLLSRLPYLQLWPLIRQSQSLKRNRPRQLLVHAYRTRPHQFLWHVTRTPARIQPTSTSTKRD
jgi:hypothetical protein